MSHPPSRDTVTAKPLAEAFHHFDAVPALPVALAPSAFVIIGVLLIAVGLALAFFGRKAWTPFMSLIGAVLGGSVGYFVGVYYAPGGFLVPMALALIGSVLGSVLFNYLVKIALALIAAGVPAALVYLSLAPNPVADQSAQDTRVIVAILVLLVGFAITYYFVEEVIGVVTALVGVFLVGAGVFLANGGGSLAIASGGLVFVAGAVLQTFAIRAAKRGAVWRFRRARAVAAPAPRPPTQTSRYPPPPPPPG